MLNQRLATAAAVLLVLSALTYWNSVTRAERFERGQKFLSNLNPDDIAAVEIKKGEDVVTLRRQGDEYTIAEANGYLAKNESVNRFIRDLLDLSLEKEVGSGAGLEEELEIEPQGEETIEVVLRNASDGEMVSLRVGKRFEDGSGHYVQRRDTESAPIFLTSSSVFLNTDKDSFLKKEIVDVPSSEIARIEGPDFVFEKEEGGSLELAAVPAGRKENSVEASKVKNVLSRLSFDEVFVADDSEVSSLDFAQTLRIELDDGSGYILSAASRDDRHFLQVNGFHTVTRVEIERDTPKEELEEKAEVLSRAEEITQFNAFHGSWVYEVPSTVADKLNLRKSDLIEPET